jgi:ribosomal protein S18 acetylase RimI-like enzyme
MYKTLIMNQLAFEKAKIEDHETILGLFKEAAEQLQSKGNNQWQHWLNPTPQYLERVKRDLTAEAFFLVKKADITVGMFRLMPSDEEYWGKTDDVAMYLHSFVTKPEFAGQGIGSEVLKMVENQLHEQGIPLFRLDCKADNQPLCDYYLRQGFTPIRLKEMPHYTVQLFEKKVNFNL